MSFNQQGQTENPTDSNPLSLFNHRRIFHELGRIPPAEFEENYYVQAESDHQVETHTIEPA